MMNKYAIKKHLVLMSLSVFYTLSLQADSIASEIIASETIVSETIVSESIVSQPVAVPSADVMTLTTAPGLLHDPQAAEDLAQNLQSINTFSAHFKQQSLSRQGRIQEESGRVLIKRPNQFRWDTRKPFHQDIVSRDSKIWMVDTDLMQVVVKQQDDTLGPTPVQLLSGNASEFLKSYQVIRISEPVSDQASHQVNHQKGEVIYTLRPSSDSELFEQLDIVFMEAVLTSMTLNDTLGGRRTILFSQINMNEPIDDQRFQVNIPQGFDVIDETRL